MKQGFKQKPFATGAGVVLLMVGVLVFILLYLPLMRQLKALGSECRRLEAETSAGPGRLQTFKFQSVERGLISEKETPKAVNELTRRGNLKSVEFVSLTTGEIQKVEGKPFQILPIEAELRANYSRLGEFLGGIDELEKSLTTVGDFAITVDKENPDKVHTRVTFLMYLME